jgi:hypothetical protein
VEAVVLDPRPGHRPGRLAGQGDGRSTGIDRDRPLWSMPRASDPEPVVLAGAAVDQGTRIGESSPLSPHTRTTPGTLRPTTRVDVVAVRFRMHHDRARDVDAVAAGAEAEDRTF